MQEQLLAACPFVYQNYLNLMQWYIFIVYHLLLRFSSTMYSPYETEWKRMCSFCELNYSPGKRRLRCNERVVGRFLRFLAFSLVARVDLADILMTI